MNKGELVADLADKANVTQKQADAVLNAFMNVVIKAVASGNKVTLVGFGTFEKRERQARVGRNPKSGEKISISAKSVPAFAPGKLFKEKVV